MSTIRQQCDSQPVVSQSASPHKETKEKDTATVERSTVVSFSSSSWLLSSSSSSSVHESNRGVGGGGRRRRRKQQQQQQLLLRRSSSLVVLVAVMSVCWSALLTVSKTGNRNLPQAVVTAFQTQHASISSSPSSSSSIAFRSTVSRLSSSSSTHGTSSRPSHFRLSSLSWTASSSSDTLFTTRLFASSSTAPTAEEETSLIDDEQKTILEAKIKAKGDEIRSMKENGADKQTIAPFVEELLALKAQLDPSILSNTKPKQKQNQNKKKQQQQQQQKQKQNQKNGNNSDDEEESDFITARSVDYSKWYNDLIRVTGLAETSPVRGCMVIKPWGMALWDRVRTNLDQRIQDHGAENAYFPLLIPKSFLSKEAEHVDGFAKECAVVTHHRLTASDDPTEGLIADPDAKLEDPLIIRPTSETMIWYMFRKWINSHRYVVCFGFGSVLGWCWTR